MQPLTLQFIAESCSGQLRRGSSSASIHRVCTDSRQVQAGDLFVPLQGERFDGHEFLAEIFERGAESALISTDNIHKCPTGLSYIEVENVRQAYGKLSGAYRRRFSIPVIAIAGSNGKTSTKELVASALRNSLVTLSSEGSFNNDVGVPATLLRLDNSHQVAVVEVGTNHPGELEPLLELIQPRIGILTSVGMEHLEFFDTIKSVAQEEGMLAEKLPVDGVLVVNGDIPELGSILARTRARILRIGFGPSNDWRIENVRYNAIGTTFNLVAHELDYEGEYQINLIGRHQAVNAALAIGVGKELGLGRVELRNGLAECRGAKMRLEIKPGPGWTVLNDAYNANADSMMAALETLRDYPCPGRRIAVLGEMAELGIHSEWAHKEVGRFAANTPIDTLFTIGQKALGIGQSARISGLQDVESIDSVEIAGPIIRSRLMDGDVVLVKASRSARLERIVHNLISQ